jgi:transcriptional regulator with XRE-family HTH domain
MTIGERIKEVRGKKPRDVFAEELGVVRNTVQRYEIYDKKPTMDFVEAICEKYNLHSDWLIFGIEPKYRDEEKQVVPAELDHSILTDAIAALEEALVKKGKRMEPDAKAELISELYKFIIEEEIDEKNKSNIAKILQMVA